MAAVVSDHRSGVRQAGDLGNVRVIDPPASDPLVLESPQKRFARLLRELTDLELREDLVLQEAEGILRVQPELIGKSRRNRIELEAAMPCRRGASNSAFGDRGHDALGKCRSPSDLDEASDQDARIEERWRH